MLITNRKTILVLIIIGLIISSGIILSSKLFYQSEKEKKPVNKTVLALRKIAEENEIVKKIVYTYPNVEPQISKVSPERLEKLRKVGLIPQNVSGNVFLVDYIAPDDSGVSLYIDLEKKKILKTQVIVGVRGAVVSVE